MIRKKKLRFIALGVIASTTFYENIFLQEGVYSQDLLSIDAKVV